jgi:hypothetical protein
MKRIPDNGVSSATRRPLTYWAATAPPMSRLGRSALRPFPTNVAAITKRYVSNAVADVMELNLSTFPTKWAMLTMLDAAVHGAEASDFAERHCWYVCSLRQAMATVRDADNVTGHNPSLAARVWKMTPRAS